MSSVDSGWCIEDFTITVSREYLSNSIVYGGINFKADGQRGDRIFIIPSFYIEGFWR